MLLVKLCFAAGKMPNNRNRVVFITAKRLNTLDLFDSGVMNVLGRTLADPQKFLYDAHKGPVGASQQIAPDVV